MSTKPVYLVGFMAAGKSSVGRCLAEKRHMPFVDIDELVEKEAGLSIASIFETEGEAGFRNRERSALESSFDGTIIATGGGAAANSGNLQQMQARGDVVHLASSLDEALTRADAQRDVERPLLHADRVELEGLYRRRKPFYRRAQLTVQTEGKSVPEVADEVLEGLTIAERGRALGIDRLAVVSSAGGRYPVCVHAGGLSRLGTMCEELAPSRVVIITDDNVDSLYGDKADESMAARGLGVTRIVVSPGEDSKSLETFGQVCNQAVAAGLDRHSLVVALGGGVVGDLAGFVAASLFRGVRVLQVPTTLLAMTDSGIGGKTGVNVEAGKNLIGAFWQPQAVLCDPEVLSSLPERELRAAFGELIKYGLLDDEIWQLLQTLAPRLGETVFVADDSWCELISRCAGLKAALVSEDEREGGDRALLNLGHTFGHAIEADAGYGVVLHGEAVALGLLAAAKVSARKGLCDPSIASQIKALIQEAGLSAELDAWVRPEVVEHIRVDKKRRGNTIRFIAIHGVGDVRVHPMGCDELTDCLLAI